jgi:hypothetical protein
MDVYRFGDVPTRLEYRRRDTASGTAVTVTLQNAQISPPGADIITILVGHHTG